MLVGQRLGPFAIERELGSGAMGAVYQGIFTKTGERVAVKVMAPGLGTRDNAAARFEREAEILKQFNHPNIVKLFGVGKFHGTPYYAMEFVEGESLDRVLARRGRLTWEEVVAIGKQLCAALQHAHAQGVIHRDLKPSNLMMLADGTMKLTDFGIAKDLDVTQLTSAHCTVGTAAYMSPEQCQGSRDLTYKSDLYSMGVLFYELLTGKKPFHAQNAMDMFLQHVKGKFERPSRLEMNIPVWLDTLVCQLLEKKPEKRPLDAAMVAEALGSIQEKVEAQKSAGVDAVKTRRADRQRTDLAPDSTDREAARTLLAPKGKVRRIRKTRFYETIWFMIVGVLALLGGLALALYLIFRPPSADRLYASAKRLMESNDPEAWNRAASDDGPIAKYFKYYDKRTDEQAKQMRAWSDQVDVRLCDEKLQTLLRKNRRGFEDRGEEGGERNSFDALMREEDGDLTEAARRWQDVSQKYTRESGQHRWGLLAAERLYRLKEVGACEEKLGVILNGLRSSGKEPNLEGVDRKAILALRYERFGDLRQARLRFEDLKRELASEPRQRPLYLLAARKVRELKAKILPTTKEPDEVLADLLRKNLDEAAERVRTNDKLTLARETCLDVLALYDGTPGLEKFVAEARQLLKENPLQ